jgi:hypothetical protein
MHAGGGRALFTGCILHELDGGHFAPLAEITHVPLIGSSPFHTLWEYQDAIPRLYRGSDEGLRAFLELFNVSLVLAHETPWKLKVESMPDFELIGTEKPFRVYRKKVFLSNYFIAGSGKIIDQLPGGVRFTMDSPEVVLKFTYHPALMVSGCKVEPFPLVGDLAFVHISQCDGHHEGPRELRFKSALSRVLGQ